MPVTSPQGTLDFKKVDKITFVGASSNTVIDTTTGSVGIGVVGDTLSSNLHVVGDTRMEGNINMLHTSNTASIKLNSNVVTEFPRSKKLIKYPRVAMTQNDESGTSGYVASASSYYNTDVQPYEAFDVVNNGDLGWESGPNSQNGSGRYSSGSTFDTTYINDIPSLGEGGFQTTVGSTTYTGEWVQIQLPTAIRSTTHVFGNSDTISEWNLRIPQSGVILGSTNGSSWEPIHSFDDTIKNATITVTHTKYYSYFRLVVLSVGTNQTLANVPEWEIFGVPEYDPEADGTDVVVKSVPNVPNTDWLEVYYDGQDYTADTDFNQPNEVLDKSGNNLHGSQNGGVGFDPTYKAFTFDGVDDYISGTLTSSANGDWVHSLSMWFKADSLNSAADSNTLFYGGGTSASANNMIFLRVRSGSPPYIAYTDIGSSVQKNMNVFTNVWYHVTATYSGGGFANAKLYINGELTNDVPSTDTTPLTLTGSSTFYIARTINSFNPSFNGSIANFRLFNRAITSDEVWQLYAYQKEYFGHGDLGMTLKAGRLGIGTSEPRAMLDVRGDTFSTLYKGGRTTFLTWDYLGQRSTSFSPSGNTGGTPSDNTILDHTFTIPSCYHHLGRANLKAHVQIDWRGECEEPWNFGFRIEIRYNNDSTLVNSSVSDSSSTSGNKINGLPCISYDHSNFDSTPEAASVTSTFALPNCDVSPGSTLKVSLVGRNGVILARTVWTGRTKGFQTSSPAHELPTTSFFVVLDVDDGY